MKVHRYELLKKIIQEKAIDGTWVIDLKEGTITTKRGVLGHVHNTGYIGLMASYNNKQHYFNAHQVIAVAGGLNIVEMQVNHKDGNKVNNRLENLEAVTGKENMTHAHKEGLFSNYKLDKADVLEMKKLMAKGVTKSKISRMYNVSIRTMRDIANGRTHKDVII